MGEFAIKDFLRGTGQWSKTQKAAGTVGTGRAAQDWLPVREVAGGVIVRTDGAEVAVIRVEPAPFGLLSDREKDRRIGALHEAIQGLPGQAQIVVVSRPVALDDYLRGLQEALEGAKGARRTMLRGYLGYVQTVVGGGEAPERRYYVLVAAGDKGKRADLLQRATEFVAALGRAELRAHLCEAAEVVDMLLAWLHPAHAARDRAEAAPTGTTRYVATKGEADDGRVE